METAGCEENSFHNICLIWLGCQRIATDSTHSLQNTFILNIIDKKIYVYAEKM